MLVLTRKTGESIRIGDNIEIVITAIEPNKVKVGIRSPRSVPVYREEVYQKIQEENRAAALMRMGEMEVMLRILQRREDHSQEGGLPEKGFPEEK